MALLRKRFRKIIDILEEISAIYTVTRNDGVLDDASRGKGGTMRELWDKSNITFLESVMEHMQLRSASSLCRHIEFELLRGNVEERMS